MSLIKFFTDDLIFISLYDDCQLFQNSLFSVCFCRKTINQNIFIPIHIKRFIRQHSNKLSPKYKKEVVLTTEMKDALIGIILGDGHLERLKSTSNTRLRVEQVYPAQEEFLRRVRLIFDPITNMAPGVLTRKDRRNKGTTQSLYFWTMTVPCLNYFHDLFYEDKTKIIPKNVVELLTPIGLAYLTMGDGFLIKEGGVMLCTDSFTKEHVQLLADALTSRFGLSCTLRKRGDDAYRLYILKSSLPELRAIAGSFFVPSMLYKLGL